MTQTKTTRTDNVAEASVLVKSADYVPFRRFMPERVVALVEDIARRVMAEDTYDETTVEVSETGKVTWRAVDNALAIRSDGWELRFGRIKFYTDYYWRLYSPDDKKVAVFTDVISLMLGAPTKWADSKISEYYTAHQSAEIGVVDATETPETAITAPDAVAKLIEAASKLTVAYESCLDHDTRCDCEMHEESIAMTAAITAVRAASVSPWRDVNDHAENGKVLLASTVHNHYCVTLADGGHALGTEGYTHFMPIPPLPKENNHAE